MEITPHTPTMNYTIDGFPLSSEDAFILYVNGLPIVTLNTENKTIVGAINELYDSIDNIDLSDYLTKTEAATTYPTKTEFNNYSSIVDNAINGLSNDVTRIDQSVQYISELAARVDEIVPPPVGIAQATFTDPSYFTQKTRHLLRSTPYTLDVSYDVNILQDIDLSDGIIEVLNINFFTEHIVIVGDGSIGATQNFYIPAVINFYDNNGDYTSSQQIMLNAVMSTEQNSYDISIYIQGVIQNTNAYTTLSFSATIPITTDWP